MNEVLLVSWLVGVESRWAMRLFVLSLRCSCFRPARMPAGKTIQASECNSLLSELQLLPHDVVTVAAVQLTCRATARSVTRSPGTFHTGMIGILGRRKAAAAHLFCSWLELQTAACLAQKAPLDLSLKPRLDWPPAGPDWLSGPEKLANTPFISP